MIQRQDDTLYMFMTSVSIGMDHEYRYIFQFMLGLRACMHGIVKDQLKRGSGLQVNSLNPPRFGHPISQVSTELGCQQ